VNDVTLAFRTYRECVRIVWNSFLRLYPDGEKGFGPTNAALFTAMLLSQIERYEKPRRIGDREYYSNLEVVPDGDGPINVLCGFEQSDGVHWRRQSWLPGQASFHYRDLFDFGTLSGEFREFQYVEAVVAKPTSPTFVGGQRVLLDAAAVRLVDIS
jgi:hypothetical protein